MSAYEQAFAAYCVALQALIDAGASVSMGIYGNTWFISKVWFTDHHVTVTGVDSVTREDRVFAYLPDYANFTIIDPHLDTLRLSF